MATTDLAQHRLAELISTLSGTSDSVARDALDRVGDDPAAAEDPLAAVAGALVAIRRSDTRVLAGTSA